MLPHLDLITSIQDRSGGRWRFVSTITRDEFGKNLGFKDHVYVDPNLCTLKEQPHRKDVFFTPLRFTETTRSNDNVGSPGVLFADLDEAIYPRIKPSIYWETSPGNTQAVWYLTKQIEEYEWWADLNRRMTHFTKADRGGWMGSKLLRVPESVNWKRRDFGTLLEVNEKIEYDARELYDFLPEVVQGKQADITTTFPKILNPLDAKYKTGHLWARMTLRGQSMLMRERVPDRSLHIVRTANELSKAGLSDRDVFWVMWHRPWNKWRTDSFNPAQLWVEIQRSGH